MSISHSGAATLPKGFRYCDETIGPKTPEPSSPNEELRLPEAPRPRLRLKRRHVSQLNAPTQQFLASVAAADVPIPSVEETDVATGDLNMIDTVPRLHIEDYDGMDIYQRVRPRSFSPPKTPAPDFAPLATPTKYPNWSIDSVWSDSDLESSPEYESSRPSTAFSTQTSASLFSQYSHSWDDESYISPELETGDFPKAELNLATQVSNQDKPRKAPWTKAMSSHLWATYTLYLSDPRVTPVRFGKSCIPPSGVCIRVAREAKRSWKGAKGDVGTDTKSGSSTPTAETSKTYMEWPHTCAATRAHLRELCKLKATNKAGRYLSRSPTPFNKAFHRRWNRRSTPARSPSIFSSQDMAKSLILSTSDSMQPDGPLAQLTKSQPNPELNGDALNNSEAAMETQKGSSRAHHNSLGSPFLAKSYGPSSSSSIATSISLPRQSNTLGPRKLLKSPVRLVRSRSGTQKRRSIKGIEDTPRKRPSLSATFWRDGSHKVETLGLSHSSEQHLSTDSPSHNISNSEVAPITPSRQRAITLPGPLLQEARPFVLSGPTSPTPAPRKRRLGSPFSSSSYSFPNRSAPMNFGLTALRRPFATVQQQAQTSSEAATSARPSLASRLAYLDQRLREFRNRGSDRGRSQSPL